MRWRSKEALDYAEVLGRCAAETHGDFVAVVQDDVLFRRSWEGVEGWIRELEGATGGWCSASLFNDEDGVEGVRVLRGSNLVGRVWKVRDVHDVSMFIRKRFDKSPVDWLVDDWCRRKKLKSWARGRSFLRHRGRVSSFKENAREGTLT